MKSLRCLLDFHKWSTTPGQLECIICGAKDRHKRFNLPPHVEWDGHGFAVKSKSESEYIKVEIPKIALTPDWNESEHKLAHLLLEDVIFINDGWFYKDRGISWKEDAVSLHVGCNDVFAWGCAAAEDITHSELGDLYDMWIKDKDWGAAAWCIKKRKQMPQDPVVKLIEKEGIWDLKELVKG
jgi:hypothetical protein